MAKQPIKKRRKQVKVVTARKVTFRQMLRQIDIFLLQRNGDGRKLWDVLSALRGPDSQDPILKHRTTEAIRTRAFPKCAKHNRHLPALFAMPTTLYSSSGPKGHFQSHADKAWAALTGGVK